jgi:hypothetical protein
LPNEYLEELANEINSVLGQIAINDDFWIQHFFDGIFFKFKNGGSYISGDSLYEGDDSAMKKRDNSILSISTCSIFSVGLR